MNIPEILRAMSELPPEHQADVKVKIHELFGPQTEPPAPELTESEQLAEKQAQDDAARIARESAERAEAERKRVDAEYKKKADDIITSIQGFDTQHQDIVLTAIAKTFGVAKPVVIEEGEEKPKDGEGGAID